MTVRRPTYNGTVPWFHNYVAAWSRWETTTFPSSLERLCHILPVLFVGNKCQESFPLYLGYLSILTPYRCLVAKPLLLSLFVPF